MERGSLPNIFTMVGKEIIISVSGQGGNKHILMVYWLASGPPVQEIRVRAPDMPKMIFENYSEIFNEAKHINVDIFIIQ